jgi:hypothetical protein
VIVVDASAMLAIYLFEPERARFRASDAAECAAVVQGR